MKMLLCSTVLATVILGAYSFPADQNPSVPQPIPASNIIALPVEADKQQKQSLFGIGFDVNLSKNGTLIPTPAFINTSASFGSGIGAGGNFLVPLVPFPLGLLFPQPPLNITVGFNANKNVSLALAAAAGNVTIEEENNGWPQPPSGWSPSESSGWPQAPSGSGWSGWTTAKPNGWGWGWTTQTPSSGWTTQPPSNGWGWTTQAPTPAWSWTAPETTPGWSWSPPETTPGWSWSAPETTPGWSWSPPPETTPGWGWGWKGQGPPPGPPPPVKKVNAPPNSKPQNSAPKPNSIAKPAPSANEVARPADAGASPTFVTNVAQSSLSSEIPAAESPVAAPEALPAVESSDVAPPASAVAEDAIPKPAESSSPAAEATVEGESKVAAGKTKRHAGVEMPAALRIEDFEDVETSNEMNGQPMQEQAEQSHEISKEEMIIMAMEQTNNVLPGSVVQLGNARPAPLRPTLNQLQHMNKPIDENEESEEGANLVDLRNAEGAPLSESVAVSKTSPKGKPEVEATNTAERGGRNKPRPYGMDKPSKNRPTLDSGMKDKVEQFGLPHYSSDLVQKEQYQLGSSNVLGWQIPDMNWASLSTIFQSFLGSRAHKKNSMGKSDATSSALEAEKCVDDEEEEVEGTRSGVISGGFLCQSSAGSSCHDACISSGFAGGNCLGPYPTPGCLCRMPNHKELGMMLSPLKKAPEEDLSPSASPSCKKCACAESCKASGSYTGFCVDKCYCAVPWYTKEV